MLDNHQVRPISLKSNPPFSVKGLYLGKGNQALEIILCETNSVPNSTSIRSLWKQRKANRASPLLTIVTHGDKACLCGPSGDDAPVYTNLDLKQIERICDESLNLPDRHAVLRYLRDVLPAIESSLPGIRNEGFLANHQLQYGVPRRSDWEESKSKSANAINSIGGDLLTNLGFKVQRHDQGTSILESRDKKTAVAVLLKDYESPELSSDRFSELTPISYALHIADQERLPYVVIVQGRKIRLYPVESGVGVGRRGRTDTFIELHTSLLTEEYAAYLWLVFSSDALLPGGSLEDILKDSTRYSGDLATKLRDRIYNEVIPLLCKGIVDARNINNPSVDDLSDIYEMAMNILYRLLFIAYAEDKNLLPFKWNGLYQKRSLKTKAQEILEIKSNDTEYDTGDSLWGEINRLFRAIDAGNIEWGVPAYGGELFSSDRSVSIIGELVSTISLPNTIMGPVLENLLLVETDEGLGPVDFRSLGVREFGTIYEGLLESELSVAETDLITDSQGFYKPSIHDSEPEIKLGEVYLHNASGARKATGSYYTKTFAVDHLLDRSLLPAMDDHFTRLDQLDDDEAGKVFFDFKVADIAMGSGHFLINAIDKMEIGFSNYIAKRPLVEVKQELIELRSFSKDALGPFVDQVEIEDTQLLRRLIARRCLYGVDINGTAVQLTRLGIWIHTFVPGLALSYLDHNFIQGNSLVGIGQLDEIKEVIDSAGTPLFSIDAHSLLGEATEPLIKLAKIKDMTRSDLERARKARIEALKSIGPASALCDIVTASRIYEDEIKIDFSDWGKVKKTISSTKDSKVAKEAINDLLPVHYPIAFPEVFLRKRSGFDVIIGNPPWEEAMCDIDEFWGRYIPGFLGRTQAERESLLPAFIQSRPDLQKKFTEERNSVELLRNVLSNGPFPGMGTGHPDLYKAFCWRFWHLISKEGGRLGIVLPRSALSAKGSTEFRIEIFSRSKEIDVTLLINNRQWIFDIVHPQYTLGLISINKNESDKSQLILRGPFNSLDSYKQGLQRDVSIFQSNKVLQWNDTASLPLLSSSNSAEIFEQLRKHPRLDTDRTNDWKCRPYQGDLNATWGKPLMDFKSTNCPAGFWPVYKGESFDIWNCDRGRYYAWIDPDVVIGVLLRKRLNSFRNSRSVFSDFPKEWIQDKKTLPCLHPRIAFRDVSRATDTRTVRITLIPPKVILANQAPYFLWARGNELDQTYVLGVMSSAPLDWYARKFVETHLNFYVINPFPIPRPDKADKCYKRVIELSGRLACPDDRFSGWAEKVGVDYGPLNEDLKRDMIEELDAVVALLYGLNEKQLIHIFETFHVGWDYEEGLRSTLKHYNSWRQKV